ncbi:hypothetical protein DPMN_035720 [Dreissena polymorpha]|uniref:Uncharacterized protein n=1 Tax=Dreissena polymorpha TaxID=45954 RepID=A0A9D4RL99_DREPO|nr:hypothetical protein DPMN_035720 [Dreissena polymorpha]
MCMLECLQTKCGRRTKTNPKTSPEQSAIFQLCSITRKTAPPPCDHFHDDLANYVTSRVFTSFLYARLKKTGRIIVSPWRQASGKLPPSSHVIQLTGTIF